MILSPRIFADQDGSNMKVEPELGTSRLLHEALTQKIIQVFYDVHNELGCGFLENVYEQ